MNDVLDDDLRTMLRTAVADAPGAPTVRELLEPTIDVHSAPSRARVRLVAVAAAVLVVAMVGALVLRTSTQRSQPADEPTPGGTYLDAYYLPSRLPTGWTVLQMDRTTGGSGDIELSEMALFERSDGTDVGAVSATPTAPPSAPTVPAVGTERMDGTAPPSSEAPATSTDLLPDARWDADFGTLTWTSGGMDFFLRIRSGEEAAARSLGAAVADATAAGGWTDVDPVGGWLKTAEQRAGRTTSSGTNGILLGDDRGRTIWLSIARPSGLSSGIELWTPVEGDPGLYVQRIPAGAAPTWARSVDGILITASPSDDAAAAEAQQVLRSMTRSTADEWAAATPDWEAAIRKATTVATFDLLDHTVTLHRQGAWRGICVDRDDGATGCQGTVMEEDGSLRTVLPTTGIALTDGSWVGVAPIPGGAEMCGEPQLGGARTAAATYRAQQIVLLVPADPAQSFACVFDDDGGTFIVMPPTP